MDTIANKNLIIIEHHCLQMQYAHLRAHNPKNLEKLTLSMGHYGQLVPVIIVPEEEVHQWVLIDGYHRVRALKRLGKDTIEAEVWNCPIQEALMRMLRNHPTRTQGILEEALVLHELHSHWGLSQQELAAQMGRKQSWVSGRLSLVENLPDFIVDVLSKGTLSLWVCVRILAPIARAIPEHAQCLLTYLLKHSHSTREMYLFYEHYQKANQQARDRMLEDPALFFKAHKHLKQEKQAMILKKGPEGKWRYHCQTLIEGLSALSLLAPEVFYRQTLKACSQSLKEWQNVTDKLTTLSHMIRNLTDVAPLHTSNNSLSSSEWEEQP